MQDSRSYRIGDVLVRMNCSTPFMNRQCEPYRAEQDTEEKDIAMDLSYTKEMVDKYLPTVESPLMFEYNYTFGTYANKIVERDGFCFHASAVSVDGDCILFSADSGTGKSTHAGLWERYMKEHEIIRLNDDKPVIRMVQGTPIAYGSPWAGKHSIHTNASAPVKALVFLEQAAENEIERIAAKQAFPLVFPQVIGGRSSQQQVAHLMGLLDAFIRAVPVYKLKCNISEDAVQLVYRYIWEDRK